MRRRWLKLVLIPLIGIGITGFAVTLRQAARGTSIFGTPTHGSLTAPANRATAPIVTSQANTHIIRLLSPTDAQFDSTLDATYPGLRLDSSFQALRQNTVLISNNTGHGVYGLVVKWTLKNEDGTSTVTYDPYVEGAGRDRLIAQGIVLVPNEVRLFSPSLSLTKGQSRKALVAQLRASNAILKGKIVLSSSLDGAVFGDITFVGPDETKLLDRFECDRNGQHDEGYSMTLALRNQPSDAELTARLNEHIQKGWTYRARTDREALYYVARGYEAQLLLQLLKQSGRAKFEQGVARLAKLHSIQLQRI